MLDQIIPVRVDVSRLVTPVKFALVKLALVKFDWKKFDVPSVMSAFVKFAFVRLVCSKLKSSRESVKLALEKSEEEITTPLRSWLLEKFVLDKLDLIMSKSHNTESVKFAPEKFL